MKRKSRLPETPEEMLKREENLRPSRFIGYNHYSLGKHLYSIGCFSVALTELERAVWLNPFEPKFLLPLAWCYYRLDMRSMAKMRIEEFLKCVPTQKDAKKLLELLTLEDN